MTPASLPDYGELETRVQIGRRTRFRFTQTPQWTLLMTQLSDPGYRLYSLLLAHANQDVGGGVVWPSQEALAEALAKSPKTISRIITSELKPLGLLDVHTYRYGQNNTRRANVYTVHEEPPDGWEGFASVVEFHTARRSRRVQVGEIAAAPPGHPKSAASGAPKDGRPEDPISAAVTRRISNYTNESAPAGRVSASDARRASTGSSERPASDGHSPAELTAPRAPRVPGHRPSRQQELKVREVLSALPSPLVALLPKRLPALVRETALAAVQDRTADQLRERVNRRWFTHGYADALLTPGGLQSPVGVAVALIRAGQDCPDPSCEDGFVIDSDAPCRACAVRKQDRRAAGKAHRPAQVKTSQYRWHCWECDRPGTGSPPPQNLCKACREEANQDCQAIIDLLSPAMPTPPGADCLDV